MTTVTGKGKPKGFRLVPEGEQVLHITEVKGLPRSNVKQVEMKMTDAEGVSLTGNRKQTYDLTSDGGYAAFYYLVLNGFGVDLDDGDEFDIDQLEDTYVVAEIVHKEVEKKDGTGVLTFSNIAKVVGKADGFDGAAPASSDGDDEDWG